MEEVLQTPKLDKKSEFKKILNGYKPGKDTIDLLQHLHFVLMVGPTAAGRNTLIDLLVGSGHYQYVVSHTTRPPRRNNGVLEQNGKEYWFKTEDEVLSDLKEGKFLEAAIIHEQQVSGINIDELQRAAAANKIAINEIEIDGADHLHEYSSAAIFVFLLPPDFNTWIQRLKGRGNMDEAELRRRLESASKEIEHALKADYYRFIVNDEIHDAARRVDSLVREGVELSDEEQDYGRSRAEQLVIDVRLFLRS